MKLSHHHFPGSPVQQGDARMKALACGLRIFALQHGIAFNEPLQCDSNGEFSLVAPLGYGSAAAVLAKHNPRCGIFPTSYLLPENCWCRMNHFDVESLLSEI